MQSPADQIAKLVGNPRQNTKVNSARCVYRPGNTVVMRDSSQIAPAEGQHTSTGAVESGYSGQAHLTRAFHRLAGTTPAR